MLYLFSYCKNVDNSLLTFLIHATEVYRWWIQKWNRRYHSMFVFCSLLRILLMQLHFWCANSAKGKRGFQKSYLYTLLLEKFLSFLPLCCERLKINGLEHYGILMEHLSVSCSISLAFCRKFVKFLDSDLGHFPPN